MAGKIDFITIRVVAAILLICWLIYITGSLILGLIAGIAATVLFNLLYAIYEKKKRPYSPYQLAFNLTINDSAADLTSRMLPNGVSYIKEGNTIICGTGELIYTQFGFSQFGMSDILKAIKCAKNHNCSMLTIITPEYDRKIYSIINRSMVKVKIITIRKFMHMLIKHNLLPDLKNTPRNNISFRDIFNRNVGGRFFLSGTIIALISIVMPIKLYYLIISAICFIIGIICIFIPEKSKAQPNSVLDKE